jgi:hypothetical protein
MQLIFHMTVYCDPASVQYGVSMFVNRYLCTNCVEMPTNKEHAIGTSTMCVGLVCKGKGTIHPITGHEGPKGEKIYNSTLSLVLDEGGWSAQRPGRFTPAGKSQYPLYRRAGLDGCRKSHPHRDSIPGLSSP